MNKHSEFLRLWFSGKGLVHVQGTAAADEIDRLQRERDEAAKRNYELEWSRTVLAAQRNTYERERDEALAQSRLCVQHSDECAGWIDHGPAMGGMLQEDCDCLVGLVCETKVENERLRTAIEEAIALTQQRKWRNILAVVLEIEKILRDALKGGGE